MTSIYDVVVVGVGSMGASACYYLSQKGYQILGIEKETIPNENGSHSGKTRIFRKAYFEKSDYVPLLNQAHQGWIDIENQHNIKLLESTGLLYAGKKHSEIIKGVKESASKYNLNVQVIKNNNLKNWYPSFQFPSDFEILLERDAGFIYTDKTIETLKNFSINNGAVIKSNEEVINWETQKNGNIKIKTSKRTYYSKKIVFCSGAWSSKLLPGLKLDITKQDLFWIEDSNLKSYQKNIFPCWIIDDPKINGSIYGFPVDLSSKDDFNRKLKFAHHTKGRIINPDNFYPNDNVDPEILEIVEQYIPNLNPQRIDHKSCMYCNSIDNDFYLDFFKNNKNIVVAAGFSGHGFKFVPIIGKIISELIDKGKTNHNIDFLNFERN